MERHGVFALVLFGSNRFAVGRNATHVTWPHKHFGAPEFGNCSQNRKTSRIALQHVQEARITVEQCWEFSWCFTLHRHAAYTRPCSFDAASTVLTNLRCTADSATSRRLRIYAPGHYRGCQSHARKNYTTLQHELNSGFSIPLFISIKYVERPKG